MRGSLLALLLCAGSLNAQTPTYSENFESGSAPGWAATVGTWQVALDSGTTNHVYQNTNTTGDSWAVYGDPSWTDYAIQTRVRLRTISGTGVVRIFSRYQDLINWYYMNLRSTGTVELRKYVARNVFDLATPKSYPVSLNTWYTMRVEVIGTTLKAYVNGVLQLTATDTSFKRGPIAIGTYNATADFDDVLVQNLAPVIAPPPPPPPPPPAPPPPPPPPPPAGLPPVASVIFGNPVITGARMDTGPFVEGVVVIDSLFRRLGAQVTWTSSDTTVAKVMPITDNGSGVTQVAWVYVRDTGTTQIRATAEGKSAFIVFTVLPRQPVPPSVLLSVWGYRVDNLPTKRQGVLPAALPLYTTPTGTKPYEITLFGIPYDTTAASIVGHARLTVTAP